MTSAVEGIVKKSTFFPRIQLRLEQHILQDSPINFFLLQMQVKLVLLN